MVLVVLLLVLVEQPHCPEPDPNGIILDTITGVKIMIGDRGRDSGLQQNNKIHTIIRSYL